MKRGCNTHELKILPKWFEDVLTNKKNFEIRKNDRNFEAGDYLILKEWNQGKFTNRYVIRQIEYIYKGDGTYGLSEDYCILGLRTCESEQRWIPCSRHLPVVGEYVLTTVRLHQKQDTYLNVVYTCFLSRNGSNELYWIREDCHMVFNRDEVLAWMPLPDTYEEDD